MADDHFAVYYCLNPSVPRHIRKWEFLTVVESRDAAFTACRLIRESGRVARGTRIDPSAIRLSPPVERSDIPSQGDISVSAPTTLAAINSVG